MAGRPRTTLKRLDALISGATALADGIADVVPELIIKQQEADTVSQLWHTLVERVQAFKESTTAAWITIEQLASGIAARNQLDREIDPNATPITIDGDTFTLNQWCREAGISPETALGRVRDGMDWENAIFTRVTPPATGEAAADSMVSPSKET